MNLEVYARPGADRMVALRSMLPLVSEQAPAAWIQIAMSGSWEGHSSGAFEFNRDVFQTLIRNFNSQKNPIPLTYEHPQYSGDGKPVPAAGWIHDLAVRGDELWAQVEFTPRAAQMVRDGEYKFCSVVVSFDSTDRKTGTDIGPELYEVGLTNVPFIDGMKPIRLSRAGHGASNNRNAIAMSDAEIIKAALKELGPDATVDQFVAYVKAEKLKQEAIEGKGAESPEEDAPEDPAAEMSASKPADVVEASAPVPAATVALEDPPMPGAPEDVAQAEATTADNFINSIAEATGLDFAAVMAALQDNLDSIAQIVAGTPASGTPAEDPTVAGMARDIEKERVKALSRQVADKDAEVKALSARIAKLEDDALVRIVDDAIHSGKFLDTSRDFLVKLGRSNPDLLREHIAGASADPAVPSAPYKPASPADRVQLSDAVNRESDEYQRHFKAAKRAGKSDNAADAFALKRITTLAERAATH